MALEMNLTLDNGINIPSAYLKIIEINNIIKVGEIKKIQIILNIYKDKDSRFERKPEIIQFYHECSSDQYEMFFNESILKQEGITSISQCYEWLKSLPSYTGAISILDEK